MTIGASAPDAFRKHLHKFRSPISALLTCLQYVRACMKYMNLTFGGNVSSLSRIHRQTTCCNKTKTDLTPQLLR